MSTAPARSFRSTLALALAALAASGCVGAFRRFLAPEQRVRDAAAARSCAVEEAGRLGYLATGGGDSAPSDSAGASRFVAERRGAMPDGDTVVDQLVVTVAYAGGADAGGAGTLRIVPTRWAEATKQAVTSGPGVPRLRPPGPAMGRSGMETDGVRRRRADATVARRDAIEVTHRCAAR